MVKKAVQRKKSKKVAEQTVANVEVKSKRITRAKPDRKMIDLETRTIADIISNTRTGDPIPDAHKTTKLKGLIK